MIDHGNRPSTLYGHCSKMLAPVSRTVEAGDVIALSGSTGRSTAPHLHFEMRVTASGQPLAAICCKVEERKSQ